MSQVPAIGVGCGAIASDVGRAAAERPLRGNKCLEVGEDFFPSHPYAKITGC